MQATIDNLVFFKNSIPPGSTWSLCAIGLSTWSIGPVALTAGGNVRIGFENSIHIEKGVRADGNAQMVAKIVRFAEEMGRETASPEEERKLLHL